MTLEEEQQTCHQAATNRGVLGIYRSVPTEQVCDCISQSSHRADKLRLTPLVEDKEGIHVRLLLVRDELQQNWMVCITTCVMLSMYVQFLHAGR